MTYADLASFMGRKTDRPWGTGRGTRCQSRPARRPGEARPAYAIRLYQTDVATLDPSGWISLSTGGWNTVTTRSRINEALSGRGFTVGTANRILYLYQFAPGDNPWGPGMKRIPFRDGIRISPSGRVQGGGNDRQVQRDLRQLRRVRLFSRKMIERLAAGKLPPPGPGDCFYCTGMVEFKTVENASIRDATPGEAEIAGRDHILSHLRESYLVPSLLARAVRAGSVSRAAQCILACRWGDPPKRCAWEPREDDPARTRIGGRREDILYRQLRKALESYILRQLGIRSGSREGY